MKTWQEALKVGKVPHLWTTIAAVATTFCVLYKTNTKVGSMEIVCRWLNYERYWLVIILPENYGLPHYEHDGKGLLMAICLVLLEQLLSKKYACRIILIKNLKTPRKCNLCYSRKHRYEDLLLSLGWCLLEFVLFICVI